MPSLLLVAHGTRDPAGEASARELADRVRQRLDGVEVRVAFVDVRPPTVAEMLSTMSDAAPVVVVVPAFLAGGYHVRDDLPAQLAAAAPADRTVLTPMLGPDPLMVTAAEGRLRRVGLRDGDEVLLGAAGSADARALVDVRVAADELGRRLGRPVRIGFLAAGRPRLPELVEELRTAGRRVAVASWLLAPGLFQRRLVSSGADVAADPLGAHPAVVQAVLERYLEAPSGPLGTSPHRSRKAIAGSRS